MLGAVAETTVRVPSLSAPLRLMHITDSHIDLGPDEESGSLELCRYLHGRYKDGFKANEQRGLETVHGHQPVPPCDAFEAQVEEAKKRGADLVVHTGDLLNFPSPKAAKWAADVFQRHGLRCLFVSGNHDWQHCNPGYPHTLEGPEMGSDALRTEWRARALQPALADGSNLSHWSEDIGGLRFIGIDNSTRYITAAQLDFFNATAGSAAPAGVNGSGPQDNDGAGAAPLPVVLLMHIPLWVEALMAEGRPDGGGKDGNAVLSPKHVLDGKPVDSEEARQWRANAPVGTIEATHAFVQAVSQLPNLLAVLTGHIHDHNAHPFGDYGAVQYTTDAGCYQGCRFMEFLPSADTARKTGDSDATSRATSRL